MNPTAFPPYRGDLFPGTLVALFAATPLLNVAFSGEGGRRVSRIRQTNLSLILVPSFSLPPTWKRHPPRGGPHIDEPRVGAFLF